MKKLENLWVFPMIKNWTCMHFITKNVTVMLCYKCSKSRTSVTFLSGYFGFTFFLVLYFTKIITNNFFFLLCKWHEVSEKTPVWGIQIPSQIIMVKCCFGKYLFCTKFWKFHVSNETSIEYLTCVRPVLDRKIYIWRFSRILE